jgi:hypothetical protein
VFVGGRDKQVDVQPGIVPRPRVAALKTDDRAVIVGGLQLTPAPERSLPTT